MTAKRAVVEESTALAEEYELLVNQATEEDTKHGAWLGILATPEIEALLESLESEIEARKERNTDPTLKADQTCAIRAEILARRDLVARIHAKGEPTSSNVAKQRVADFEETNGLLMAAIQAEIGKRKDTKQ